MDSCDRFRLRIQNSSREKKNFWKRIGCVVEKRFVLGLNGKILVNCKGSWENRSVNLFTQQSTFLITIIGLWELRGFKK